MIVRDIITVKPGRRVPELCPFLGNSHIFIYSYFLWQSLGVYSSQTVLALVRMIKQLLIRFLHARLFLSLCENVENESLIVPYLNSPCLFSRIISKLNIFRIIPDLQYSTLVFFFGSLLHIDGFLLNITMHVSDEIRIDLHRLMTPTGTHTTETLSHPLHHQRSPCQLMYKSSVWRNH